MSGLLEKVDKRMAYESTSACYNVSRHPQDSLRSMQLSSNLVRSVKRSDRLGLDHFDISRDCHPASQTDVLQQPRSKTIACLRFCRGRLAEKWRWGAGGWYPMAVCALLVFKWINHPCNLVFLAVIVPANKFFRQSFCRRSNTISQ